MSSTEEAPVQCPMMRGNSEKNGHDETGYSTKSVCPAANLTYGSILQVKELLSIQEKVKNTSNEQHLFIIIHQVYELWFKQVIMEVDTVRDVFMSEVLDERHMLMINNRLQRCVLIWQTLVQQLLVLETMTALDFMAFRDDLGQSSGFQSLQFRLLENKLGIKEERRVKYQQKYYKEFFDPAEELPQLCISSSQPSLLSLLERWLERTPGLEPKDFHFWMKYKDAVDSYLQDTYLTPAEETTDEDAKAELMNSHAKAKESFDSCIDPKMYERSIKKGERLLSHKAFQGALMIALYRDEPRFNQPYKMLNLLMDLDNEIMKWRHNHASMVQRMIGHKPGTGGSSGYSYLRSTVSDRYRPFLDLFNLPSYLIPRQYTPDLSYSMKKRLSLRQ